MSGGHTPGLLFVAAEVTDNDGAPETVIQGLDGAATVAVALDFGPHNPGMRAANARRLVACWNACRGMPTEALELSAGVPLSLPSEAHALGASLDSASLEQGDAS